MAQLVEEGSILNTYRGKEYEGEKTYFSYVKILDRTFKVFTLPNFHPQVQQLFSILGQEPILKTDSRDEADRKKYCVYCTVDSDSNLIL